MGYVPLFMWPAWLYCLSLLLSPWLFGGTSTFRGLSVREHFYEFAMWLDDKDGVSAPMVRSSTRTPTPTLTLSLPYSYPQT